MKVTRKAFLDATLWMSVSGLVESVLGCSGSTIRDGDVAADGGDLCSSPVEENHVGSEHALRVSKQDVQTAKEKYYDIQGRADHNHIVTITAEEFGRLANGEQVRLFSSFANGHLHSVDAICI